MDEALGACRNTNLGSAVDEGRLSGEDCLLACPFGVAVGIRMNLRPSSLSDTACFWGAFPGGPSGIKNSPANRRDVRDTGSIPRLGRSPGGRHGNPLQCSSLENPMHRGVWWATVHGVTKELGMTQWLTTTDQCLILWIIQNSYERRICSRMVDKSRCVKSKG